jgi:hypothetical protein
MMAKTIRTALVFAAAMLAFAIAARAEPYHHHRYSSAYGDSPVYWGVERRVRTYRDCCGWRWTLLNPREASIRQVNPRLRARSDGRLLEEVGTPPPQPEFMVIWPDSSSSGSATIIPWGFGWHHKRGHHQLRSPNSGASRGSGASGSYKSAR